MLFYRECWSRNTMLSLPELFSDFSGNGLEGQNDCFGKTDIM
jgi:hypothetical protein